MYKLKFHAQVGRLYVWINQRWVQLHEKRRDFEAFHLKKY